jgi:hypothetical protein
MARRDSGAAIVEMAILLPILIMLVMGIFELGAAFKSYLTASNAVREGTRILSARGTDQTSDCVALVQAMEGFTAANDLSGLVRVEIFEASPSTGNPIGSTINEYAYGGGDPSVCASTPPNCGSWDCLIRQLPSERNALVGNGVSPDLIGMRIIYTHNWLTGIPPWTGSITIDEQTISRIEPEGFAP